MPHAPCVTKQNPYSNIKTTNFPLVISDRAYQSDGIMDNKSSRYLQELGRHVLPGEEIQFLQIQLDSQSSGQHDDGPAGRRQRQVVKIDGHPREHRD